MNFLRKLAFWSIAVIFPLPLVALFETESGDPDRLKNIIVLGLVAYCWWLLAVLLSARPGWLDRRVGLPAIYGLHGMLGVLALGLAYIHSQNSYAPSALARDLGEWALYGSFGLLCFSVFFLSGWLVDRSQLVGRVKALLEKVVRRQLSVWVHRLNLLVIAAIWLHVHLLGRASEHFAFMVLFDFYTVSVLGVYVWKKWISPDGYLTGTVRSNIARGETTRVVTVVLDRPDARIRPGDFFFLRFEGSKAIGKEWHPFSVTGDSQKELTFTIRQHGDYTRKISDVEVGTRVRLEGSFGRFESIVQGLDDDTPLVLLGMGAASPRCSAWPLRTTSGVPSSCCGRSGAPTTPTTATCWTSSCGIPAGACGSPPVSADSARSTSRRHSRRMPWRRVRSSLSAPIPPCSRAGRLCAGSVSRAGVCTMSGSRCSALQHAGRTTRRTHDEQGAAQSGGAPAHVRY